MRLRQSKTEISKHLSEEKHNFIDNKITILNKENKLTNNTL